MTPVDGLQDRLERLETAVDVAGVGLWDWDVRTGAITWNPRNYVLYGVAEPRPLTLQETVDLVHPEDRERLTRAYAEASRRPEGGDYELEYRAAVAPEGKTRWLQVRGRVLKDADGVSRVLGSTLDITDRKAAEERRSLVLRELAHRAKNGILVMMAIVAQTARRASSVPEFEAVLTARLKAMADSQDLVTQATGRALPLTDLLGQALTPFDAGRFDIDPGLSEIQIPNDTVVAVALLLHELSTNAVKYGALSAPSGRVALKLAGTVEGRAVLGWTETGGPPVQPVTRKGFGTRLLDISLRNNGGHVESAFDPSGFRAKIHFPTVAV